MLFRVGFVSFVSMILRFTLTTLGLVTSSCGVESLPKRFHHVLGATLRVCVRMCVCVCMCMFVHVRVLCADKFALCVRACMWLCVHAVCACVCECICLCMCVFPVCVIDPKVLMRHDVKYIQKM